MNERTVYIYTLTEEGSNDVRYVGQTVNLENRLIGHLDPSKMSEMNPKRIWVEDVLSRGGTLSMNVIEETNLHEAKDREQYWINYYVDSGSVLTNSITASHNPATWLPGCGNGMAKNQVSISTSGNMRLVLNEALERFPNVESDAQALTMALTDWYLWRMRIKEEREFHTRVERRIDDSNE